VSAGKVVLIVFGAIFILISIGMILGGGALVWVDQALKDSEGFVITDTIDFERGSYAITTQPADIILKDGGPGGGTTSPPSRWKAKITTPRNRYS